LGAVGLQVLKLRADLDNSTHSMGNALIEYKRDLTLKDQKHQEDLLLVKSKAIDDRELLLKQMLELRKDMDEKFRSNQLSRLVHEGMLSIWVSQAMLVAPVFSLPVDHQWTPHGVQLFRVHQVLQFGVRVFPVLHAGQKWTRTSQDSWSAFTVKGVCQFLDLALTKLVTFGFVYVSILKTPIANTGQVLGGRPRRPH